MGGRDSGVSEDPAPLEGDTVLQPPGWLWSQGIQVSVQQAQSHGTFIYSLQFSSVTQSCPTLCNPMDCSITGFPVHHQLPEFTQTHVH